MHHYEDLLVDLLLDSGFTVDEATKLVALQTELENAVAREQPWTLPIERLEGQQDRAALN